MTIHTPAQAARIAVTRARFGKRAGQRRKQLDPAPLTYAHSNGIIGPTIKVLDQDTRSLIDDAMRKRAIARADS